jgi:hypothetical protein
MERKYIIWAIPFAIVAEVSYWAKNLFGYTDNTLTVLGVASLAIVTFLVLKAFNLLRLPRFNFSFPSSQPQVQEIHHHHYHDRCEDCGHNNWDDDEEGDYSEEDLAEAREEGRKEGYDDGYDQGHDSGYDAGYQARKDEESSEAEELANVILSLLEKKGVVAPPPASPLSAVDAPVTSASQVGQAQ